MILTLSSELFVGMTDEERPRFWSLIYELSGAVADHALLVQDGENLSPATAPAWLSAESPLHQDEVWKLLELGLLIDAHQPAGGPSSSAGCWRRAGPLRVSVERRTASDWRGLRLSLGDAVAILKEPLRLILENGRNDFAFVKHLSDDRTRGLLRRLDDAPGGLAVVSGGTGEVKAWLRKHVDADALDDVQLRRLWKTWVMFDMDASREDAMAPSETIEEIIGLCERITEKHGVPLSWVCLQRREIESYIPDSGLPERHRAATRRIRAARAAEDQKRWAWAYDMKRGLVGDLLASVPEERRDALKRDNPRVVPDRSELKRPFDALDDEARSDLARGFGKGVLNDPLNRDPPPDWLDQLREEYDRGPAHQLPRLSLIQSLVDRV